MKPNNYLFLLPIIILALPLLTEVSSAGNWLMSKGLPEDRERLDKLHFEFCPMEVNSLVWDFGQAVSTGKEHQMVWHNFGDTLLLKAENGRQLTYNICGDSVIWTAFESPLMMVSDKLGGIHIPYLSADDSVSVPYQFEGTYCNDNDIGSRGKITFTKSKPGTLILPDDTLRSVFAVSQISDGEFKVMSRERGSVAIVDSLRHRVLVDRWFSPVYKYALVENIVEEYYTDKGVVKKSVGTFICPPSGQDYSVDRSRQTGNKTKQSKNNNQDGVDGFFSTTLPDITVEEKNGTIEIALTNNSNTSVSVDAILSDQLGRVWDSGHSECTAGQSNRMTFATDRLPAGYYILSVTAGEETFTHKFNVKQ